MAKAFSGLKKAVEEKKAKKTTLKAYKGRLERFQDIANESGNEDIYTYVRQVLEEKTGIKFTWSGKISEKQDITPEQRKVLDELIPEGGKKFDYSKFVNEMRDRMDYEEQHIKQAEIEAWNKTANKLVEEELDKLFYFIYEGGIGGAGTQKNRGILREKVVKGSSLTDKTRIRDDISDIARKAASGEYTAFQLRQDIDDLKGRISKE